MHSIEYELLLAEFVVVKAMTEAPALQAKLFQALANVVQHDEVARKLLSAAQHARELISEVEQLRLDIAAGASRVAGPAQEVTS